jgi:hypothetical protein
LELWVPQNVDSGLPADAPLKPWPEVNPPLGWRSWRTRSRAGAVWPDHLVAPGPKRRGDEVLRMLVTGDPPARGGGMSPHHRELALHAGVADDRRRIIRPASAAGCRRSG